MSHTSMEAGHVGVLWEEECKITASFPAAIRFLCAVVFLYLLCGW